MVYVDPLKLEAHQLSVMDVVRTVNDSNLILPAGDVQIGPFDYNIYTNSQLDTIAEINQLPLKTVGGASVLVADVGKARDASQIQTNIVRVDGQRSVYLPGAQAGRRRQHHRGGGRRQAARYPDLLDVPKQLVTSVVFDQSVFVKTAIENLHARRRDRAGADRADDPGLPRQHARHGGGVSFDSAVGAGGVHRAVASATTRSTRWCWAAWRWRSRG